MSFFDNSEKLNSFVKMLIANRNCTVTMDKTFFCSNSGLLSDKEIIDLLSKLEMIGGISINEEDVIITITNF